MAKPVEKVQIDLYYDVISPYAWIAFESLLRYERVWSIKVNLKPFSLRGIMQSSGICFNYAKDGKEQAAKLAFLGNRPPGLVPAKGLYMLKDIQRNNAYWNLNLKAPKNFMEWIKTKTSNNAMKLLLVVQKEQPGKWIV
ncbi:hypothetical protein OESDEN_20438 [Oesophagostomum dentatum]|uniref:DSBA-like thioredoxin domain-containing protein n=1 Tax=Oesophagostomum dentatum TaxID=61180 RepID=A0A0B1S7L7_OESDE|nr:hypothetical protein OESDEN_20438 [Oesophagostomum dentatum]